MIDLVSEPSGFLVGDSREDFLFPDASFLGALSWSPLPWDTGSLSPFPLHSKGPSRSAVQDHPPLSPTPLHSL